MPRTGLFHFHNYFLPTESFKALPALNTGTLRAAILISAPVCGLRPLRASRLRTSKLPKPTRETLSPLANAPLTAPITALRAFSESFLVSLVSFATFSIRSALVKINASLIFGLNGFLRF